MSTARTADGDADAESVAAALGAASFVSVRARAAGDELAASGLLARALREAGVPFQVRTMPMLAGAAARDASPESGAAGTDSSEVLVLVGGDAGGDGVVALGGSTRPVSVTAFEVAAAMGSSPDPLCALAGVVAAERVPGAADSAAVLEAAEAQGLLERRPGVALPTADLGDGLAYSTLAHAPWSGDSDAVRAALASLDLPAELDDDAHRRVASLLALEVAGADWSAPRAATAVERALRPYATPAGPFETLGGYADVLEAVAVERPGTGVAMALGRGGADTRRAALDAWRSHGAAVHGLVSAATTARHDGVFVARVDETDVGRLRTAARVLRDFRSPEPVALVAAPGVAGAAGVDPREVGAAVDEAAASVAGEADTRGRVGAVRFDGETQQFVTAFREALA